MPFSRPSRQVAAPRVGIHASPRSAWEISAAWAWAAVSVGAAAGVGTAAGDRAAEEAGAGARRAARNRR
ncbi:hypothetical protein DN402_17120 [Streptomyces sp. SW4]|nr:hypothetical protein DN402_17120 [Streptomyces sp. SW4]